MGQSLQTITSSTTKNQISEPDPKKCQFCGNILPWRPLEHPLITGKVLVWLKPFRCECPESEIYWEKYDREEAERLAEEQRKESERERMEKVKRLFRRSQLPERFKLRTFENYILLGNKEQELALRTAEKYVLKFNEIRAQGTGLIFTGQVGTGKSHLAAAITMALIESGYSVIFGTVTSLLGHIKATYDEDNKITERQIMDQLINVSLLVIDDLGKEKPTPWVEQMLYEIINTRYENNRPVIITSNIDISEISDNYPRTGQAIESRIIEMCHGVRCEWEDYRKSRLF